MERSTVGSLLRSTQAFCGQLCEKRTLEFGIAYYQKRYADLPEANQFREVVVEDAAKVPRAFEEAEAWFRDQHLFCYRWAPAGSESSDILASFLSARGFRKRTYAAMVLTRWEAPEPVPDVRVLHARAMRAAFRQTFTTAAGPTASERSQAMLADAYEERLDDPQFDMFIALTGKQVAGRCALYQVGDIGRVMELAVLPGFEGYAVDQALATHTLTLAKRLQMRKIVTQIDADHSDRMAWFGQLGFVRDGIIVEFERDRTGAWKHKAEAL